MTREEIIRLSYAASNGSLTRTDYSMLLMQYCLEKGKPYAETTIFVTHLLSNPDILAEYFLCALHYYQRKFAIFKLYSKPNPLLNGDGRSLILIY